MGMQSLEFAVYNLDFIVSAHSNQTDMTSLIFFAAKGFVQEHIASLIENAWQQKTQYPESRKLSSMMNLSKRLRTADVAILGAGPSGLTACKAALEECWPSRSIFKLMKDFNVFSILNRWRCSFISFYVYILYIYIYVHRIACSRLSPSLVFVLSPGKPDTYGFWEATVHRWSLDGAGQGWPLWVRYILPCKALQRCKRLWEAAYLQCRLQPLFFAYSLNP